MHRHGKFLDIDADGTHLVFHLARAGWLRWSDQLPTTVLRPGKSPIALRVRLSDGSGFDLTEAGTKKSLAAYIVTDPAEVPGIARLGPDPLADDFTLERFRELLAGRRTQIKGLLRDQEFIAGVGNAYSDEILHVAKISPFAHRRHASLPRSSTGCMPRSARRSRAPSARRRASRPRSSRTPSAPACGCTRARASRARSAVTSCARCPSPTRPCSTAPTCQTGGKPLADRRMSRLLK